MLKTALPFAFQGERMNVAMNDIMQGKKELENKFKDGSINSQQFEKQKKILIEWSKYLKSKQ